MPTVASILRNIEDLRIPRAVSNVLREEAGSISKASTFLHEELQAIKATGKAVTKEDLAGALRKMPDADRTAFRNAYTKYRTAMLDTMAPGAKVPTAEIDNNFFNGVLKGVGDSVQEKALLRAAVLKNDPVLPKGVSAADYAAHKPPTAPAIELSAKDKATREAVQAAENAKASQQIAHGETRGARTEAVTEGRKTAAEQAEAARQAARTKAAQLADDAQPGAVAGFTKGEVKKFSAVDDLDPDKAIKAFPDKAEYDRWTSYRNAVVSPKLTENVNAAVGKLDVIYKTTGNLDISDFFVTLRRQLTDPAKNMIRASTDGLGRADNLELLAPKDILNQIRQGKPVTQGEFTKLESFFSHYDVSKAKPVTNPIQSSMGTPLGKPLQLGVINAGRQILDAASREGVSTRIPRNLESLFETGREAGWLNRMIASTVENPLIRRTVVGLGITAGVGIPTVAGFQSFVDPRDYGQFGTTAFNAVHQDWLSASDLDGKPGVQETTKFLYNRLTAGAGAGNDAFIQYTRDITGIDLGKELEGVEQSDPKYREALYNVAASLANNPSSHITSKEGQTYNSNAMTAYKFALSRHIGMDAAELTADAGKISDYAKTAYVKAAADKMISKDGAAYKDSVLKEFYGRADLDDTSLVTQFATYQSRNSKDELLRLKVGNFLVKKGLLKEEQIVDPKALQEYARDFQDKLREQQNADLARAANTAMLETFANGKTTPTSSDDIAPDKMADSFNKLTDPNFGGIEPSKATGLKALWLQTAGSDSILSSAEQGQFKEALLRDETLGLTATEKQVALGILVPHSLSNGPR